MVPHRCDLHADKSGQISNVPYPCVNLIIF